MAKGKRAKSPLGTMTGDWNPFLFQEYLFRVGTGESRPQPPHGYPLLEMLRWAKYGFDKHRHLIPEGKVLEFEDRLTASLQNAALVEVHHQAELRLLDRLLLQKCILAEDYERHLSDIHLYYRERISDAAYGAANWLAAVQNAITPRGKGRPRRKLLPDEDDVRDWQIVLVANAQVVPPFDSKSPLQQCLEAIPAAVRHACDECILKPNLNSEVVATGKQYEAHTKRISAKAMKWLGD